MGKLVDLFEVARGGGPVEANSIQNFIPSDPSREIFTADFIDCTLKGDWHSMEHPMFALSKTPDRRERHYEHNGNSITITPSVKGFATIWDKDILIHCVSS